MNFTSEQHNIFKFIQNGSGNGIIDAVAGAGKTTTIMECARFIGSDKTVLFCAFNKSISKEIENKLKERGLINVTVKTIHALGWQMLNLNRGVQELKVNESKYDTLLKSKDVQISLKPYYEEIIKINGLNPELASENKYEAFAINSLIFQINKNLLNINQKYRATLARPDFSEFEKLVTHFGIFNEIEFRKSQFEFELKAYFNATILLLESGNDLSRKSMVMDFTDMIYLPIEWKLESTKKFDFLFIDECQDLSRAQLATVAKYGSEKSRILSVGDPRQSIYGFTGADIESFQKIKDLTRAIQFPLTSCFRCPKAVIELAKSIREDIVGVRPEQGIVAKITKEKILESARPNDLIISRLRAPLLILVFSFIDRNIKVLIHEDDVKEIMNDIKSIFKHEELNLNISKMPNGFISLKESAFKRGEWMIRKESERIIDPMQRVIYVEEKQRYLQQRLEFLNRKYEQWKLSCPTVYHIINKIRDFVSSAEGSIKLSTIHKAKGLENDRVFILDYDKLPLQHIEQKDWEKTQEMNLKYVAVTRAKAELYLTESSTIDVLKEKSLFDILPFDS
jgi:superfamily I DNA/RNA helicase